MSEKLLELEAKIEALGAELTEKDDRIEALEYNIQQLKNNQPVKKGNPKLTKKSFKVGKKTYQFTVPAFYFNGDKLTAEEALKDEKILKQLVDEAVGVITEV